MKPRTKLGRSLGFQLEMTKEVHDYWNQGGGCAIGENIVLCRDPEYGYGMSVMAECHERDQRHALDEPEVGHRVAAFLEVAHDAWLAMSHAVVRCRSCVHQPAAAGPKDYMLASLYACPLVDIRPVRRSP